MSKTGGFCLCAGIVALLLFFPTVTAVCSCTLGGGSFSGPTGSVVEIAKGHRANASSLLQKNRFGEAVEAFNTSISFDPYTPATWSGRGKAQGRAG